MNVALTDTQEIEGIGPQTSAALAAAGVRTVSDLLITPPDFLHTIVSSIASYEQVRVWRASALLMQVDGITAQWAEALAGNEVDEFDRLLELELADLRELFATAVNDSVIPTAPTVEEIFSFVRRASAVHNGAKAQGFVLDATGQAVPNAEIRIGYHSTSTNSAGFWQILKLDAGQPQILNVIADGFEDYMTLDFPYSTDDWTMTVHEAILRPGVSEALALDEFDGDVLPPLTSYMPDVQRYAEDDVRDGDTLVVHELYKRSPHARLVSIFRGFSRGRLLVRAYKIPLESLPSPVNPGSYYAYRGGQFKAQRMSEFSASTVRQRRRRLKEIEHELDSPELTMLDKFRLYFGPAKRDA